MSDKNIGLDAAKFSEAQSLGDNWDEEGAVAVTNAAAHTASHTQVIPAKDGGMVLQLGAGGIILEVFIDPNGAVREVQIDTKTVYPFA